VTLLDAYALVALVADEPAAADVEDLLRAGEAGIPAVNLAEAVDVCGRVHGVEPDETRAVVEPLFLSRVLSLRPSGASEAWLAADLRIRHYNRRQSPLSVADCLLLAHALREGERIATADPHVAGCARLEDVTVVPLPGSTGARP
jgi:predicted nucleic acid-binding protein